MERTNRNIHIKGNFGFNLGEEFDFSDPWIGETNIGEKVREFSHKNSEIGMDTCYVYTTPKSCKISEIVAYKEIPEEKKHDLYELFGKIRKYLLLYGEIDSRKNIGMLSIQQYSQGIRELRFETEKTFNGYLRIFLRYIDNDVKREAETEKIEDSYLS